MNEPELKLPVYILEKAVKTGNEYGWKKEDVLDVIEAARKIHLATIGGQVQYVWPDGTCELYWLSYDSEDRKAKEGWVSYCDRTAFECSKKFTKLITADIEKDAIKSFDFIQDKFNKGVRLDDHQVFILYFSDQNSDNRR